MAFVTGAAVLVEKLKQQVGITIREKGDGEKKKQRSEKKSKLNWKEKKIERK